MRRLADALTRRLLAIPAWIFVLAAVLLRLAFAWKLGSRFYQTDESSLDGNAWNLASRGLIGSDGAAAVAPPVPVAFFAACYVLFGHDMLYARLAQAFVGAATAWLIGRMTRDLTDSPLAGRLALAVAAIYPFFIYYNGILLTETSYLLFIVPGLWFASSGPAAPSWKRASAGFCLALAGLCRTEVVPIACLIWAGGALACLVGRDRWRGLALAVLCWSLPLLGWAARNRVSTGEWTLDNHGGITLLIGTRYYDLNEGLDSADAFDALEHAPLYAEAMKLPPARRDKVFRDAAFQYMRENPGTTVRQWARKLVSFWRFYPRTDKVYGDSRYSRPGAGLGRGTLTAISLLFEPGLILGGLLGLWMLRSHWSELYPILIFLSGTTAIHVLVVSQMRYRLPVMPFLIFGAVAGLVALRDRGPVRVNRASPL